MHAHYFQHVPFEGLGSIGPWLESSGFEISSTRFFETYILPSPDEIDLLVVMGGPMSVHDEKEFPWITEEKKFISDAIEANVPVLGVCLGAQLIASAMGAPVYRNHTKEIGWFPIQGLTPAGGSKFLFPASIDVFHWHGETFDLPSGAVRLATSAACENQAFQIGDSVLGLQFHLETTPESATQIVIHCRSELIPAEYIQSEAEILSTAAEKYQAINDLMGELLSFLTAGPKIAPHHG